MNINSKLKTTLAVLWVFLSFGASRLEFLESAPKLITPESQFECKNEVRTPNVAAFSVQPNSCNLVVSPSTTQSVGPLGGTTNFTVVIQASEGENTAWSVTTSAGWITVFPSNGTGSGSFTATYDSFSQCSNRSGTITVSACGSSQTINVTQTGCCLSVTPTSLTVGGGPSNATFIVSSNSAWTASTSTPWITINSPGGGSGNGSFSVSFADNATGARRSGTITVFACGNFVNISITQNCDVCVSVAPTTLLGYHCVSTNFDITSNANWTVTSNASWITKNPSSGSNNGTVNVFVAPNDSCFPRTGTLTVTATIGMKSVIKTVTVTQWAVCLTVTPSNQNVGSGAGSAVFNISTNGVAWTASTTASWISLSPAYGPPSGIFTTTTATYTANNSNFPRTGYITITSCGVERIVTITQQGTGSECTNDFEPANNSMGSAPTLLVSSSKLSQIGSSTDKDWWKFVIASQAPIIGLTLTNLPANYDLYLKNSSGTTIASSTNAGTTDEYINAQVTSGTYFAYVTGVNGAYNTTQCYNLSIFPDAFKGGNSSDRSAEEVIGFSDDMGEELDFEVYPNPTTGITEIVINNQEMAEIQVLNQMGQLVFSNQGSIRFVWDASESPSGVYTIRLLSEKGNVVKQVKVSH